MWVSGYRGLIPAGEQIPLMGHLVFTQLKLAEVNPRWRNTARFGAEEVFLYEKEDFCSQVSPCQD